ncbi:MAG: P-loop NTPase [Candidatus Nitrospinota bacterium M3_3B_026]
MGTNADRSCLVWAIGGAKGGVGKTQTAAALGVIMAGEGRRAAVLDASLDAPGLHTAMGMKRPERGLSDFFLGRVETLDEIMTPSPVENLFLIPGMTGAPVPSNVKNTGFVRLKNALRQMKLDAVLLDLGPGTGAASSDLLLAADTGLIVTTPEPASVELVYGLLRQVLRRSLKSAKGAARYGGIIDEEFADTGSGNLVALVERVLGRVSCEDPSAAQLIEKEFLGLEFNLAVNMARDDHDRLLGPSICEIADKFYGLSMNYSGYVPYDGRAARAGAPGKPFIVEYGASDAAACFNLVFRELLKNTGRRHAGAQLSLIRS